MASSVNFHRSERRLHSTNLLKFLTFKCIWPKKYQLVYAWNIIIRCTVLGNTKVKLLSSKTTKQLSTNGNKTKYGKKRSNADTLCVWLFIDKYLIFIALIVNLQLIDRQICKNKLLYWINCITKNLHWTCLCHDEIIALFSNI